MISAAKDKEIKYTFVLVGGGCFNVAQRVLGWSRQD